jgi:hypothetical protein
LAAAVDSAAIAAVVVAAADVASPAGRNEPRARGGVAPASLGYR